MRLVCPNCDAEYEVDDTAIPRTGRDVQCSNCGHAWFQLNPEVIAEEEEEEALFGASHAQDELEPEEALDADYETPAPQVVAEPAPEIAPEIAPEPDPEPDLPAAAVMEPPPAPPAPAPHTMDASILAVLREEAEREAAARKAEMPALETQTEMPLDQAAEPSRRSVAPSRPQVEAPATAKAEPPPDAQRPRREMLPAIEEINSSLRATSERGQDEDDAAVVDFADEAKAGGGFRRGFLTLVLLGVIILALYVFAPLIAAKVPALAGVANAYVIAIDAARLWLDTEIRTLIGWLRGFEGGTKN